MSVRERISRAAVSSGWISKWEGTGSQEYRKGDLTVAVSYRSNGAIELADWYDDGAGGEPSDYHRHSDHRDKAKAQTVVGWLTS
jgi:hypothetical protein